ncbi:MAG TPA: carboxypeptidase regulatory-like domain-containing protein [Gemmatimonadaceae bacterium]|nr:carboxypeptidase regulatory-like domain-containing protein [Gemmatimonadaceae bacterium]
MPTEPTPTRRTRRARRRARGRRGATGALAAALAALAAATLIAAPLAPRTVAAQTPQTPQPTPATPQPTPTVPPAQPAAPAQPPALTTLTGTVYDSVAGRPLPNAFVQLVQRDAPANARGATTDSTGHFRIDSVGAGQYVIGFQHPRLDSLLLEAPVRPLAVGGRPTQIVELAIPSGETLAAATCRLPPDATTGLLIGHVRDADSSKAADSARVIVSWTEMVIDRAGARKMPRAVNTMTDAEGRYVLCGVPAGTPVVARASADTRKSGEVNFEMPARGLVLRDLLVAAPAAPGQARRGTARVTGRVQRADGTPLPGARVQVYGSTAADTTDATGTFTLAGLPPGSTTLEARAVGFVPRRTPVNLANATTASATVQLQPLPPVLDTVRVQGRARSITGFLERSESNSFGTFIKEEDIERRASVDVADLLRTVPGMQVMSRGMYGSSISLRGCTPAVFLDGMLIPEGAADISILARPSEVAGIEVYRGTDAPPEFQRGGCGSVVIWTKRGR